MPRMVEISINVEHVSEFAALYGSVGTLLNQIDALGGTDRLPDEWQLVGEAIDKMEQDYDRIRLTVIET